MIELSNMENKAAVYGPTVSLRYQKKCTIQIGQEV